MAEKNAPTYSSVDRKGVWYGSNAKFPMEDPTNMGNGPLTRFEAGAFLEATPTPWAEIQWKAGVFDKYTGDPRDADTKKVERPPVDTPAVAAAPPAPTTTPAPTAPPSRK